jgi:sulfite exporter TauE/SafE
MTTILLISALLMGLFGGAHCLVMCGGVVGVLCSGLPSEVRGRPLKELRYVVAYNAGRITSYAIAGAIAGGVGAVAGRIGAIANLQLALRVIAGLLMLGVGLYLAGAWRTFSKVEKLGEPLWRKLSPLASRLLPVRSTKEALVLGLLWGWMPCGLVYAALAMATAVGSPREGALAMAAFGVGTLPALVLMGTMASLLSRLVRLLWVRRAAGAAIVCFGVVNLASAIAQAGWMPIGMAHSTHACCAARQQR